MDDVTKKWFVEGTLADSNALSEKLCQWTDAIANNTAIPVDALDEKEWMERQFYDDFATLLRVSGKGARDRFMVECKAYAGIRTPGAKWAEMDKVGVPGQAHVEWMKQNRVPPFVDGYMIPAVVGNETSLDALENAIRAVKECIDKLCCE